MNRNIKAVFAVWMAIWSCSLTLAQQIPTAVTVAYLELHPKELDGQLVRVRARLVLGWEGDNFLYDQPGAVVPKQRSDAPAKIWFYWDPKHERDLLSTIKPGSNSVIATFTGYFHFVPNKKGRMKDVFDPGPLQFSSIEVSDLKIQK